MRNAWIYPHDAEKDTRERWAEVSGQIKKEIAAGKVSLPGDLLGDDKYDIPSLSTDQLEEIERALGGWNTGNQSIGILA